jgi:hypothetical protein
MLGMGCRGGGDGNAASTASGTTGGGVSPSCAESTTPESGITKEDFVTKENAICTEISLEYSRRGEELASKNLSTEDVLSQVLVPLNEKEIGQIRALGAPAGREKLINAMLTAMSRQVAKVKADPAGAVAQGSLGDFAEGSKIARSYGLNQCTTPGA